MNVLATATLSGLERLDRDRRMTEPVTWIEGRPRPDIRVDAIALAGRADRRTATLSWWPGDAWDAPVAGQRAIVLYPVALQGGEARWIGLVAGRITSSAQRTANGEARAIATLVGDWAERLGNPVDRAPTTATAGEALNMIAAEVDLDLAALPDAIMTAPRRSTRSAGHSLGDALQDVLEELGLSVQRDMVVQAAGLRDHRTLRRDEDARRINLEAGAVGNAAATVAALRAAAEAAAPVKLIAAVDGQIVEGTFELLPAWNPALQDASDTEYARATSTDFDAFADVFRLWVLNEDASLDAPVFDLTSFLSSDRTIEPQPLRFGPALSVGDLGHSLGIVVERSVDGGASWSRQPGRADVLEDRAGIHLNDDTLEPALLDAVRAGTASLRVTATLQSPNPIEAVRWVGNPFRATRTVPARRYELGSRFAVRRIHPGSRYAAEVAAGTRTADLADQTIELGAWLTEQARRVNAHAASEVTVTPTRCLWHLRPGDVVERLAGQRADAVIVAIDHDWLQGRSRLRLIGCRGTG